MRNFMRKFEQLNGMATRVLLSHYLFDGQVFDCEEMQTINDESRIGVVLKGQEKFIYKQDITIANMNNDIYTLSDGKLTIIVNKL
jgi:hypothetical protein